MATENIENNNSAVGNSSSNPSTTPADLSYKSQNIIGSKSRKKKDAEFAADKLKLSARLKDRFDKLHLKKVDLILIIGITILVIGIIIGAIILINHNSNQPTEDVTPTEDETTISHEEENEIEETENDDATIAARAEARAALENNPNDYVAAGDAYSRRINEITGSRTSGNERNGVADALIDDAEEFFAEINSLPSLLAMYTSINYNDISEEPDTYWYYKRIIELANELNDRAVIEQWQPIYDKAAAGHEDDDDEIYYDEYGEEV